ncbi:MAG: RNA polymerase sigma factor [Candidatus Limnocylindria bacterium]
MREAAKQVAATHQSSDAETVIAAQRGDDAALARLIRTLADELMPLASALTGGSGEADALLGDTLSRVYERLDQLEQPAAVHAWARTALIRRFLDQRRWIRRRPTCRIEAAENVGVTPADPALIDVRDAVRALDRRDRALLVLHYWQHFTIAECARELGIPEGTTKSRLNRALQRLRVRLGEHGDE